MNNQRLQELLKLYLENSASELELTEFRDYINDPLYGAEIKELIGQAFDQQTEGTELSEQEQHDFLKYIYSKDKQEGGSALKLWPRIAAVAAILLVAGAALVFFNHKQTVEQNITYKNDIAPGRVGATLTLANGSKISLSDTKNGELAKEAGVTITKDTDGQLVYVISGARSEERSLSAVETNVLSTAKGETYKLRLPDGSLVWLNAASSLTYSAALNVSGVRRVKLDGEAYFEIARDKVHPFVVESKGQKVEVLGTHFNINAYADEKVIKTTLLEGSVRVSENGLAKMLVPGCEAVNSGKDIELNKVDTELAIAWKDNTFMFESQNIADIMRIIERWYNVEVIFSGPVPLDRFSGTVSRFDNVSHVLRILESTGGVHFKIEGRKIYVSK